MNVKKILIVEDNKSNTLKDYFNGFNKYKTTKTSTLEDLKKIKKFNFDFCIINIKDNEERDFCIYHILQKNNQQKIIQLFPKSPHCFFEKNCEMCENYNFRSLIYDTDKKVQEYIENFDTLPCEFKQ